MLEANRIMLDLIATDVLGECDEACQLHGRVRVGRGSVLRNSTVRGPVAIGEGCEITDAYIGPYTSIGDGCKVLGSEVEHSILLRDARLEGIGPRVADSLLGVNSVVRRTPSVQAAVRVMIGDNSEVDLG